MVLKNSDLRYTEPVFVNVYGAQESISPASEACRAGTINRVVVPARQAGNRFMGSLKGLQIRALDSTNFSYRSGHLRKPKKMSSLN